MYLLCKDIKYIYYVGNIYMTNSESNDRPRVKIYLY